MLGAMPCAELRSPWLKKALKMPGYWKRRFSLSSRRPTVHVLREPVDEELLSSDRLKYFHPTQPGQILDGRFKTIAKLGFGSGSTVWLAENLAL
jgi:hypothetical protein